MAGLLVEMTHGTFCRKAAEEMAMATRQGQAGLDAKDFMERKGGDG